MFSSNCGVDIPPQPPRRVFLRRDFPLLLRRDFAPPRVFLPLRKSLNPGKFNKLNDELGERLLRDERLAALRELLFLTIII